MTVQELLQRAYATSRLNEKGRIADESGELLNVFNEVMRGYFADGARVNRKFFSDKLDSAFSTDHWPRPTTAEMILGFEAGSGMTGLTEGEEIAEIPFDQLEIEPGKPAIYELGQKYYPAGRTDDPSDGTLVVVATVSFTEATATSDTIDTLFPASFLSLPKYDLAIYLALKDGDRQAEVEAFTAMREREYARYTAFLEHASTAEVRSYGHGGRFTSPRVQPR